MLVVGRAGGGEAAEQRQHRRGGGELAQHRVGGERERVGEQDRAPSAPSRSGSPPSTPPPSPSGSTDGVERRRLAAVERRRPDGHGGAVLDLARLADHAAGAAADERGRARALVDALERRLGRGEVRAGGEHEREVAGRGRRARRAPRPPPRRAPKRASGSVESPLPMRTPMPGPYPPPRIACAALRSCGRAAAARRRALRPDRRRQDGGRDRARRAAARRGRGSRRGLGRRAAALRAGWRSSPARRPPPSARGSSTGWSASCRVTARATRRRLRAPRARRDRRAARRRAGARSSSAAPASTCAPRSPSSTCARPPTRRSAQRCAARLAAEGAPALHAELRRARPAARPRPIAPTDAQRVVRALELLDAAASAAPGRRPAVDARRPATRRCWSRS